AICQILGVHSIRYEGDNVFFVGARDVHKRGDNLKPFQQNNPSLKRAYARLELFDELINGTDCHPGNIFVEARPGNRYCARRIDLDMSFGEISNIKLSPADS